ncbi:MULTISPECIES: hypothetical protein [Solibacillus]|uniref:Uncharacterized protein n=1 Tax=Solibacillus merdavium TaxID=2762218 RepID=A0ABR8XK94_9BACL|nr:hypothetical protein [Solibacillus merdavium]MBD8032363.1 hypothetical protein [Solibacillus merdavium]
MELDKLKKLQIPAIAGWISVASGLFTLLLLNISMLTNNSILFEYFSLILGIGFIFAWPAIFSKKSRFLGVWALGIILFLIIFLFNIFFLSWIIVPFP